MSNVRLFSAGPISLIVIILFIAFIILIIPLLILGVIGAAFTKLGFSWITALAVVLLMLLGSTINIPLYRIKRDMIRISPDYSYVNGDLGKVPDGIWETIVSLNFGGAVIPICVSGYLVYRATGVGETSFFIPVVVSVLAVSLVTFIATRAISTVGIRVPLLIPALTALLLGLTISGGFGLVAAVTAFVSGTAGTLIGGNFAKLNRIRDLEVTEVSIGGAGTFGAIFICCILPALIA